MPGFVIAGSRIGSLPRSADGARLVSGEMVFGPYYARRETLDRFAGDKVFRQGERYTIITEGVILNGGELCDSAGVADIGDWIESALARGEETFFDQFRGAFSGAVYDKVRDELTAYTSHIGDSPVFYSCAGSSIAIASQVDYLPQWGEKASLTLNRNAVYAMLSYGFMAADETYAEEIRRLRPGHYLKVVDDRLTVHRYHRFEKRDVELADMPLEELVRGLDVRFRRAVAMEFDKDLEYGYEHLADLSGGLDSRMTTWVAKELGYGPIVNLVFSQSGYLDETIASEIAAKLGNQLYVRTLDDASFLREYDEIVALGGGLGLYSGITGARQVLRTLNLGRFGLEHTGQLGDVVVGSFSRPHARSNALRPGGLYSTKLASRVDWRHLDDYDDYEIYMLYQRGFNGALSSHLVRRHYVEVASPFLDVDLISYCLSMPSRVRGSGELYRHWLRTRYPDAAAIRWERTGARAGAGPVVTTLSRLRKSGPAALERKLGLPARRSGLGRSMNPFEYWFQVHPELAQDLDAYFHKSVAEVPFDRELRDDIGEYYANGTAVERTQAVTAVSAVRRYFQGNGHGRYG